MDKPLESIGSRTELDRYVEDLEYAKNASSNRLALLSSMLQTDKRLQEIRGAQHRLRGITPATSATQALLSSAYDAGNDVKARITDVLFLYERALSAREMTDQVIELRNSIQGIYGAMEVRDWERAAHLASVARAIPQEVLRSEFARKMVPSIELPESPETALENACNDLETLFVREFTNGATQRQMDQVTRYFKLFPLIGRGTTGLEVYAKFICQIIAGLSRKLLVSADQTTKHNPAFFGAALTRLFENIAVIIDQHSRVVSKHYGPEAMPSGVMPRVQTEIDKQAGLIIDTFWDERRMETLLLNCKSYSFPFLVSSFTGRTDTQAPKAAADDDASDLQEASQRLGELGTILNRWKLYTGFISQKWQSEESVNLVTALESSVVNSKIADILGPTFAALQLFVFRRSVERAVQLDELPTRAAIEAHPQFSLESPLVSSVVDDVMYVFSNLLSQIIDAGHLPTQLSALAGSRRVLESDLVGTFQRKLRASAPTDASPHTESAARVFTIYLNDLEICAQYVNETVAKQNAHNTELAERLSDFAESFKHRTSDLLADGCQTLAAIRVAPLARTAVSSSFNVAAYSTQVETGRCGPVFESQWRNLMRPLVRMLHPRILVQILSMVLPNVAQQLEQFVWSLDGKLTELGSLALDKDMSSVIALTSEVQYSLRHRFVKLAQMVNGLTDRDTPGEDLNALSDAEHTRLRSFRIMK